MCGIVGAVAERDVTPILMEGLKRLEYRGYDSAGLAVLGDDAALHRLRTVGKVAELERGLATAPFHGRTGIGHTRWATHGVPSEANAHPHISRQRVAVVHNGIIENFQALRQRLEALDYAFQSETDSEAIAHLISLHLDRRGALAPAVRDAAAELEGAYALGVIAVDQPDRLVAVRRGSPLVVGVGIGERFIASDRQALLPVTHRFIDLHDGEVAELTRDTEVITGLDGQPIARKPQVSELSAEAAERGGYRHFMLKEIFEQPVAIANTLQARLHKGRFVEASLGPGATALLDQVRAVHIVACGTSFHAGMVARYWLEGLGRVPCTVEVASEYRYRRPVVPPGTLFITLSQSGETADTLAALREAKTLGYVGTLAICNVAESSLVRESGLALMTHAGPEIGVASTKAFTTQLAAMLLLVLGLGRRHGLDDAAQASMAEQIAALPAKIEETLALSERIEELAEGFAERHHALFLGRGAQYPVAMEGALKLKEISYIHAEAYPAGEIKHGPLALVDDDMPVISVAPNNELLEKLKSNLQEVSARGGRLVVFADSSAVMDSGIEMDLLQVAPTHDLVAPVIYTVPLQLLAYYVAVLKGTDVDKPRNLAKSVTVE